MYYFLKRWFSVITVGTYLIHIIRRCFKSHQKFSLLDSLFTIMEDWEEAWPWELLATAVYMAVSLIAHLYMRQKQCNYVRVFTFWIAFKPAMANKAFINIKFYLLIMHRHFQDLITYVIHSFANMCKKENLQDQMQYKQWQFANDAYTYQIVRIFIMIKIYIWYVCCHVGIQFNRRVLFVLLLVYLKFDFVTSYICAWNHSS